MGDWASPLSRIRWFPGSVTLSPGSLGGLWFQCPLIHLQSGCPGLSLEGWCSGLFWPVQVFLGGTWRMRKEGLQTTPRWFPAGLPFEGSPVARATYVAQLAGYLHRIPTGQKATCGPGRTGLDLEPLEEPWKMAGEPPCLLCPCPSSKLATPPPPLLPHCPGHHLPHPHSPVVQGPGKGRRPGTRKD